MSSFEDSILRVLKGDSVVGAAFLVSDRLVATCAHVIKSAGADVGGKISLRLPNDRDIDAVVESEFWRDPNVEDISILRLEETIENIQPVILGPSSGTKGHNFSTFGFPNTGQELSGGGEIIGQATINVIKVLQLRSPEVTPGFSGAPIFDEITKRVVAMVVAITPPDEYQRLGATAFAIPSETIREICSELQISDICPYRSLDVFNEEDAPFFFGRESVVKKMIDSLKREPRFLAMLGPSGSGKSSVVRAGLIPALKRGKVPGSDKWGVITIRPGNQPFEQLDSAGLMKSEDGLEKAARSWCKSHPEKSRLVLIVDQFEELLVSTLADIRQKFIKELAHLLDSSVVITIIITLRDDFYSRFLQGAAMLTTWLERGLVNIPTMLDEDELRAMVIEPAKTIGLNFEEGLVEVIISDAVEADRTNETARSTILPLLEFALTELWERRKNGWLTHNAYILIDGVTGGLTQWADQIYHALNEEDRFWARRILTDLVHLGDPAQDLPDSKRKRTISDLFRFADEHEQIHRVVRNLTDGRLLVTGRDDKGETVELIHDALIREWALLRGWMQTDRDFRTWREQLQSAIKQWIASNKDDDALLRGAPLLEAEAWQEKRNSDLTNVERNYIIMSAKVLEREIKLKAQRQALINVSRQLSSLTDLKVVPQEILIQLPRVIEYDHSALFLEDIDGVPRLLATRGFPTDAPTDKLNYEIKGVNVYHVIAKHAEALVIGDVEKHPSWSQPDWLEDNHSWLGTPLYTKNKVNGMLVLSRKQPNAFDQDDVQIVTEFATEASSALENSRLYSDLGQFNQMMERMVEQRVNELQNAYSVVEQLDKNKNDWIHAAGYELRTPLTVILGYMEMIKSAPVVKEDPALSQAMDGVLQGTNRLRQIVDSLIDIARLENQVIIPNLEAVALGPVLRLVCEGFTEDLEEYHIKLELDPSINTMPPLLADSELLKKAFHNIIVNAITFTRDGGAIFLKARPIPVDGPAEYCEISIRDTGIGIDPANHKIIFEKLYQLRKGELPSIRRTKFKGSGQGVGLAIVARIVKLHGGKIWVESPGYDEEKLPGSAFIIQIPLNK